MRHAISVALLEHQHRMDEDVQNAINAYCTPENISFVVTNAAREALSHAIREEVRAFFTVGNGRKAVAAAVKESLLNGETYTILDTVDAQ